MRKDTKEEKKKKKKRKEKKEEKKKHSIKERVESAPVQNRQARTAEETGNRE